MYLWLTGVAQGVITGIRSLCYGLGPALFGFVFYLFHVDVEKADIDPKPVARNVSQHRDDFSILQQINEVCVSACCLSVLSACLFWLLVSFFVIFCIFTPAVKFLQGQHKPGILRDFSEHGKLMEFSGNSVQPQKNYYKWNSFSAIEYLCKTTVETSWPQQIATRAH